MCVKVSMRNARLAGILYLLVIVFGIFAELYVNLKLIVLGDASATASNILAFESLFRIGFISGLLHHTCFLLLVLILYRLLKEVNKNAALLMMVFGLSAVPIMMFNMLNQFAGLLILSGLDYLSVFSMEQLNALALLFFDLHSYGYFIAGIFSGIFLLPLGFLVFKSRFMPKTLGILVMLGCFGYLLEIFAVFVLPSFELLAFLGLAVTVIAEFSLTLSLLLRGIKEEQLDG